jgi:opacity protein-like surface antigen
MNHREKNKLSRSLYRRARLAISLFVLVFGSAGVQAQTAVSASGGNGTGTGGSAAYTIGQPAYTNFGGESGSINLGVQQPNLILTVSTDDLEITLSASVFPNPASSSTSLKLEGKSASPIADDLTFNLYDINGKLVLQQAINAVITNIPMDHLTNGVYVLQVTRKNIEIKSFKVFKTN